MAVAVEKRIGAEDVDADTATTARNADDHQNEAFSSSPQTQPLIFGDEWRLALDVAGTTQSPQPAVVIPKFVIGLSSQAATAIDAKAAGDDNLQMDTSTSQMASTAITFNFNHSTVSGDSAGTESSSLPTAYQFGSFQGLHNVTPVPSPKAEPFKLPDDYAFDFSLPSPMGLSPRAVAKMRTPRRLRSSSMSNSAPHSPSTQSARPSNKTGQSSASEPEPTLLLRNRSHSELGNAVASSQVPVVTYDVFKEPTPRHPFFSKTFQATLLKGAEFAKAAADIVKSLDSIQGCSLDGLLKEAQDLCSFQGTNTRTIAILGDSGQGKSSLINSLLNFPGLAKTGDTGAACTSVVTEYRQKQPNQKDNILIEAEILSRSEIEEVVTGYLWNYRRFYNADNNNELGAEEYRTYDSAGALGRIQEKLIAWANEIDWPDNVEDSVWRSSAKDAEECLERTRRFMGDKHWPFTKIIRVYTKAQILTTGVVLADLPGLQDTNLARVKATQDYLMKCNTVFVVANIARAITDQSLKSSLFSVLARHVPLELEKSGAKALRVAVICTRAEEIDINNAKREFCGPGQPVDPEECGKLESAIEAAKGVGDKDLKRLKRLKLQHKLLFIEARNQHVKEGLQREYASVFEGQKLDIFCVSNKSYDKHVAKGNDEFVTATGIPDLRRFCHTITAEAQFQEAAFFEGEKLVSRQQSMNSIQRGLDEMAAKAASAIHQLIEELNDDYRTVALLFDRSDKWQDAAANEGKKWQHHPWHWTQYDAWCRNNGHHETQGRGRHDWNALMIWKMRTELEYEWNLVEEEIQTGFCKLQRTLEGLFANLQEMLVSLISGDDLPVLKSALSAQTHNVTYRVQRAKEEYAKELSLTRRYASETNFTSFIVQQMTDTYRHAAEQNKAGKYARQKALVQGRITDGLLFPTICALISDRMQGTLQITEQELLKMIQAVIEHVRSDFTCALGENPDERQTRLMMERTELAALEEALKKVKALSIEAGFLSNPTEEVPSTPPPAENNA